MDKKQRKIVHAADIAAAHEKLQSVRRSSEAPASLSLMESLQASHGISSMEDVFEDLKINFNEATANFILTTNDVNTRFLVPEIFTQMTMLGVRQAPIWPSLVRSTQSIGLGSINMPSMNMSDAAPRKVGEGETMTTGSISFGNKKFEIEKFGRGIVLTYEVLEKVKLPIIQQYFKDFGTLMGYGVDSMAIDCLINGEQVDGSESAPVLGVATTGTITYDDMLIIWIRQALLHHSPTINIMGEGMALEILGLDEFKLRQLGAPLVTLDLKGITLPTNVPTWVHPGVEVDQTLLVDTQTALMKFDSQGIMLESEKAIANQTVEYYMSFRTGFAKSNTGATVVIDKSLDFATHGFPAEMSLDASLNIIMD